MSEQNVNDDSGSDRSCLVIGAAHFGTRLVFSSRCIIDRPMLSSPALAA